MSGSSGFPWKTVIIVAAILGILLCCAVVMGGGAAYFLSQSDTHLSDYITIDLGDEPETQPAEENSAPPPTEQVATFPVAVNPTAAKPAPSPTIPVKPKPTRTLTTLPEEIEPPDEESQVEEATEEILPPEESPQSVPKLTGKQERSDYRIFDDFSSDALNWYQSENDSESVLIKNGVYTLHARESAFQARSEFPVDFIPYEIAFDVKGPSGVQDGTFGVECQYKDDDNLYYVEFDLETREYTIAEINNGVQMALTKVNSVGQYWQPAPSMKSPPTAVNHIAISCYLDNITVFVNDKLVGQVDVKKPLPETGYGTFYVYSLPNADENGYSVSFDNVDIFQPRQ